MSTAVNQRAARIAAFRTRALAAFTHLAPAAIDLAGGARRFTVTGPA